jgi:hypothetical protein
MINKQRASITNRIKKKTEKWEINQAKGDKVREYIYRTGDPSSCHILICLHLMKAGIYMREWLSLGTRGGGQCERAS